MNFLSTSLTSRADQFFVGLLGLLLCMMTLSSLVAPITTSDPLEYAYLGRQIFENRSVGFFPLTTERNYMGFNVGGLHPPAFSVFQSIFYFYQNSGASLGYFRFYPLIISLVCLFTFLIIFKKSRFYIVIAGFLLFLFTPRIIYSAYQFHIDLFRISAFVFPLAVQSVLSQRGNKSWILFGVTTGFSAFSHSIGLLSLIANGLYTFLINKKKFALFMVSAVSIVGFPYLSNFVKTGSLFGDMNGLWIAYASTIEEYFRLTRELHGKWEIFQFGFGSLFWRTEVFALTAIAGIVSYIYLLRTSNNFKGKGLWHIYLMLFGSLFLIEVVLEKPILAKNFRYILTLVPFFAFFIIEAISELRLKYKEILVFGIGFLILTPNILLLSRVKTDWVPLGYNLAIKVNISNLSFSKLSNLLGSDLFKLGNGSDLRLLGNLGDILPSSATVVSYAYPETYFYTDTKQLQGADPYLKPIYELKSSEEIWSFLKEQKITHFVVPNWLNPMMMVGNINEFLNDRRFTRIFQFNNSFRVIEVLTEKREVEDDRFKELNAEIVDFSGAENCIDGNEICAVLARKKGIKRFEVYQYDFKNKRFFKIFEDISSVDKVSNHRIPVRSTKSGLRLKFEFSKESMPYEFLLSDVVRD